MNKDPELLAAANQDKQIEAIQAAIDAMPHPTEPVDIADFHGMVIPHTAETSVATPDRRAAAARVIDFARDARSDQPLSVYTLKGALAGWNRPGTDHPRAY